MLAQPDIPELLRFALSVLPTLTHPDGTYCFERHYGGQLSGQSARYGLMVRLGLQRARWGGACTAATAEALSAPRPAPDELTLGDRGLQLWADARDGRDDDVCDGAAAIARAIDEPQRLDPLEGMEIAWLVLGLCDATTAGADADRALRRLLGHLYDQRLSATALFRHLATRSYRRNLPNFATEIYTLLALARVAKAGLDDRALPRAVALAERLVALRRPDGGWPWLYDAARGIVIEEYEVYSVHQDAMAPMAFFELAEATGNDEYARTAVEGLAYDYGANELGACFYDDRACFAHRSIRRCAPLDRAALATNSLTGRTLGHPVPGHRRGPLELNRTCRPYHLGWILEAWSDRPAFSSLVTMG